MVIYVKILFFSIFFFYLVFSNNVDATPLIISEEKYAYENDNNIYLRDNGQIIDIVEDAKLLDFNSEYLVFNRDETIYLYDLSIKREKYISYGYNALIYSDFIVYESSNGSFKCKNVISGEYSNCYKLFIYDIEKERIDYINIEGDDIYINDLEGNHLVYNSIHINDKYCDEICSYIGIYNLENKDNILLYDYEGIDIEFAGNGYISNNIVIFEAVINDINCSAVQVLKYNLINNNLTVLLDNGSCFNKDIEILEFDGNYFLFKSHLNNYENNEKLVYVYSIRDSKYSKIYLDKYDLKLINNEIAYLDNHSLNYHKIDNIAPYLDNSLRYDVLLGKQELFSNSLKISDNLTSKENIEIILLDEIVKEGEYYIDIKLVDDFYNQSIYSVLVNVVKEDITPPRIYLKDIIMIKKGDDFNINNYGYSIDDIDGRRELYLSEDIDINKKGNYKVKVVSSDSNNNISYKEIEVVVYDNNLIYKYYIASVFISALMIVIIYIFRFKKWLQF